MESFIQRAREFSGASVLAYEGDKWFGTSIKYMPSSFFKKFGFEEAARDGSRVLLFLDLGAGKQPALIHPKTKPRDKTNTIMIDALYSSQCPWSKWMIDQIKRNIKKHPGVVVNIVNTDDRKVIEEFGLSKGICIDGQPVIKRMASWREISAAIEKIQTELC